jgi:hypothetical protein
MAKFEETQKLKEENVVKTVGYNLYAPFLTLLKGLEARLYTSWKFFVKNFFKTKFMVAMSKKIQMHGIEKVFLMGPRAFFYFFMFYLIRDTIIYIVLPIYFARMTGE